MTVECVARNRVLQHGELADGPTTQPLPDAAQRERGRGRPSMQPRSLEESRAVGRFDLDVEGVALAVKRERHIDAGGAKRPELSVELPLVQDLLAIDGENHVAGPEFG